MFAAIAIDAMKEIVVRKRTAVLEVVETSLVFPQNSGRAEV
jgi:hypothetical protein